MTAFVVAAGAKLLARMYWVCELELVENTRLCFQLEEKHSQRQPRSQVLAVELLNMKMVSSRHCKVTVDSPKLNTERDNLNEN